MKNNLKKYVFNLEYIRGLVYYFLNYIFFKKIGFHPILYSNVYIRNKKDIELGKNITFGYGAFVSPKGSLIIGDNTWIGNNCFLCGKVIIGNNVMIGPNVSIPGANHNYSNLDIPMNRQGNRIQGTIIKDDVWIGANSVILDGVTIESGSIIAAGSTVTKDVEPFSIIGCPPARKIKDRDYESHS